MDIHPLDQQLHDPRLLGGKELAPQRVELGERLPRLVLGDVVLLGPRGAPRPDDDLRLPEDAAQLVDHRPLDLRRRHAPDRAGVASALQDVLADVVAVEPVALPGVGRRHGGSGRPEDQPSQQRRGLRPGARRPGAGVLGEDRVHLVPQVLGDDRRVLARVGGAFVDGEPEVGPVAQALVEVALVDRAALGGQDALRPQLPRQHRRRADAQEPLEHRPHHRRIGLVHHQLAVLHDVAERHAAAHPHALLPGRPDLVAHPLGDDLPLELGEGEQDVERQPPHGRRGVEALGDRDEGDARTVEHLDELREVHQRPRQPVDLVDHHDVNQPLLDVGEELLQTGPLQRAAGEAAVVVGVADQRPSLRALAGNVGLAGLALGLQRVELLVEPLLGGLAGVDRAPELAGDGLRHAARPWRLTPKKMRPFQRVPVIARAMAESERYGRPSHS